jgi:hypothetical protein
MQLKRENPFCWGTFRQVYRRYRRKRRFFESSDNLKHAHGARPVASQHDGISGLTAED